ncbi:MAG: ABC transporter permease [Spirochaetaceae bacterium]|jgi:ABC-2 type transport system permease protein|nr:ABC transporter permease [Spirochaetaceae bacterium]
MNKLNDTAAMTGRMMKHMYRSPDTVITVIIMPVMMLLLFVYVLGGAMSTGDGSMDYKAYIIPGIMLFCVATATSYTAWLLNEDISKGIFERFHSLPIAKSSILNGHVITSLVFNFVSIALVLIVALIIGFRPQASFAEWLIAIVLMAVFVIALSWMAVFFGLIAHSSETASVFTYPIMGLIFVSSAFAPLDTMPPGLHVFAQYQPLTPIINSFRSLLSQGIITGGLAIAFGWCLALWALFQSLSAWAYRRRMH